MAGLANVIVSIAHHVLVDAHADLHFLFGTAAFSGLLALAAGYSFSVFFHCFQNPNFESSKFGLTHFRISQRIVTPSLTADPAVWPEKRKDLALCLHQRPTSPPQA